MPEDRPFLLGLTGNIACGKSLVTSILADLGAETVDADKVAHELMQPGGHVLGEVAERFGPEVFQEDGSLDRAALGQIVFSDAEALEDLEKITHPAVVAEILERARESSSEVFVIDAIKLFEAGLADHCDQTWAVICEPDVQRQRLMARNGFDEAEANRRIQAQPPQSEKTNRVDTVIDNSQDVTATRAQVESAWQALPRH